MPELKKDIKEQRGKMEKLKIEYIEVKKLNHYAGNSKIHTQQQIEHIANSIKEFGFNDPLGVAGNENIVLEGNGRVEAAKLLGIEKLPCVRLDHLTKQEQKAYVIAHNSLNLETGFDDKKLQLELKELQSTYDFTLLGFKREELLKLNNINDEFYKQLLAVQTKKLVRNGLEMVGKYDIPIIHNSDIELSKIKLFSYGNTKYCDVKNMHKTIHFFIHDYKFECVYENAEYSLEKLKQYYAVCSPDFSLYMDMPLLLQMYNTFKNRWCGAYWQSKGLNVIPTISWSDEKSFEFCFDGIEKNSVVAVSVHGNHKCKDEFLLGYKKMLEVINPRAIICYGKPFPEMKSDPLIVFPYNHYEHGEAKYGY